MLRFFGSKVKNTFTNQFANANSFKPKENLHTTIYPLPERKEIYQVVIEESKDNEVEDLKKNLEAKQFFVKDKSNKTGQLFKTSNGKPYLLVSRPDSVDLIRDAEIETEIKFTK